jgi:hypothetical protein
MRRRVRFERVARGWGRHGGCGRGSTEKGWPRRVRAVSAERLERLEM